MSKFAGRKLCRIDLLDDQFSLFMKGLKVDAHRFRAAKQEPELLIESE